MYIYNDRFQSVDVEITIDGIKTSKFVAEDPDLIETAVYRNVLVLLILGTNLSDDTISFPPDTATITTAITSPF
ncbi:hypothetical protein ACMGD3_10165 [Lysinibacillus sphaericus]|uniref:hypothetical protein n=1 Tax=Lysinibacillus sphaericus TaxID=1421 RepID=UPI001C5D8FA8